MILRLPGVRLGACAVQALLATVALGLAFGDLLRTEFHEHAVDGSHHASHGSDDPYSGGTPASGETESLHAHACVAPVVLHLYAFAPAGILSSPTAWSVTDASTVPRAPPSQTPHRPPIA